MITKRGDSVLLDQAQRSTEHRLRVLPPMNTDTHQFRFGFISSPDELTELWAIDNSAYGAASITCEKFRDWWRAYPPGSLALHWEKGIGAAIGMWPISDRAAERLKNSHPVIGWPDAFPGLFGLRSLQAPPI
jgi:hypothetical protein